MSFAVRQMAFARIQYDIAIAHDGGSFLTVYNWNNGFGAKYANPAVLPAGNATSVSFANTRNYIAVGFSSSPFVSVYNWSNGFGSKFADPSINPGDVVESVSFSSTTTYIATAHPTVSGVPITVYGWSGSGFGTRYTNTAVTSNGTGVAFGNNDAVIFLTNDGSPRISAWAWSGSGFGTKYANPSVLPGTIGQAVAVSPANDYVAVAHSSSPYFSVYPWNISTGFGTRLTPPSVDTVPATGNGITFHPTQSVVAIAHNSSPYITIYSFTPTTWSKFTNPATLPTGSGQDVRFSPDGANVAVVHGNTPYVSVYPWSVTGFGTKYANPGTAIPATGYGISWMEK